MNILIVDDSALARIIVRQTLEENGRGQSLHLFEASDGEKAMKILKESPIDLVFVDWNMPVLDGLSFVRQVRASGIQIPIIMITAVVEEDKVYEACTAGITDYIGKPIQGPQLWARIGGFIK